LGAPIFWVQKFHIDGFRIDAVSAMLYRDYGRKNGEWIANDKGGNANFEAVSLLREMNKRMKELWPGIIMSAEESTSWSGITKKLQDSEGALGFDFKWDMGWMNDTLSYLSAHSGARPGKHDKLTFRGVYMPNEKWVLPLSHDEVVHGKGSLVDKMNREDRPHFYEKARLVKALYGYQVAVPGRPLLFMGSEFAQGREWNYAHSLDWHEGQEELRSKMMTWVSDLMGMYQNFKPLHAGDDEPYGAEGIAKSFEWTEVDNRNGSVVAFARLWEGELVWFVGNFSFNQYPNYAFGVPTGGQWKVLLNSDDNCYGGKGFGPMKGTNLQTTPDGRWGWPACLRFDVPALSCLFLSGPEPSASSS
jgi:1,4-alpha-glucan branching enzyme